MGRETREPTNPAARRLKAARIAAGYASPTSFAKEHDHPDVTYRSHENGTRQLTIQAAKLYAPDLNVSWQQLCFGEEVDGVDAVDETQDSASAKKSRKGHANPGDSETDYDKGSVVHEIDVRLGAGLGGEAILVNFSPDGVKVESRDLTRAEWGVPDYITAAMGVKPKAARMVPVIGDSMEPNLRAGDHVMVNTADRHPMPPGIFAVWADNGCAVKRVEIVNGRSDPAIIRLISDNAAHQAKDYTADEVTIIGRVVWFARRIS